MTFSGLLFLMATLAITIWFAFREAEARRDWFIPIALCVIHVALGLINAYFSRTDGADATFYWELAQTTDTPPGFGTKAIVILVHSIVKTFGIFGQVSFLDVCILFQLFGLVGLFLLNECIGTVLGTNYRRLRYWAWICVLMPGLSFWTSELGKDGLMLLAICLTLFASLKLQARIPQFAIGFVVAVIIRPHIAAAMLIAVMATVITKPNQHAAFRIGMLLLLVGTALFFIPIFQQYLQLDNIDLETVTQSLDTRSHYNLYEGSSLDISQYSLPLKIFTFLFRPLFLDMSGWLGLAASVENLCLLLMIGYAVKGGGITTLLKNNSRRYGVLLFTITTLVMSMATANLGLAERQKIMCVAPMFMSLTFILANSRLSRKKVKVARVPQRGRLGTLPAARPAP